MKAGRDSNLQIRLQIEDNKEAILHLTPRPSPTLKKDQEETALLTNSNAVVTGCNAFFETLWTDARDVREILKGISSDKPRNTGEPATNH